MTQVQLAERIQKAIDSVINGSSSEYIKFTTDDDDIITFRISNHMANPIRTDENTHSLVIQLPEEEEEDDEENYNSWSINKKTFRNIQNQYFLNEDGYFIENYETIEDFLEYILN